MDPITPKQLKYLNILLVNAFGKENRLTYLQLFYQIRSSKNLTKELASEIIERFVDDNPEREKNVALAKERIYEFLGQTRLF